MLRSPPMELTGVALTSITEGAARDAASAGLTYVDDFAGGIERRRA